MDQRLVIQAGALSLGEDGRYEHRLTLDTLVDGALVGRDRWTDRGRYRVDGSGVDGSELAFVSERFERHAFSAVQDGASLIARYDLYLLLGQHLEVALEYRE